MVVMPDIMTLADERRRRPAPRPPGQDDRPLRERRRPHGDPRRAAGPAPAGGPRVADEHRRLRLEVRGALLPVDRGHGPADQPADDGPAVGPRGRRLVPHRRHAAASTRRPANEVVLGANGLGFQVTQAEQGGLNKVGINCIRAFPGRGIRDLGRPHAVERPGVALHQRAPALQLRLRVDHGGHAVERVRAQRRAAVDAAADRGDELPDARLARRARCSARRPTQAFFVKCDAETNPPEVIEAGQVICEIGIAPVKPAEFVIFRLSQFTGGGGAEVAE